MKPRAKLRLGLLTEGDFGLNSLMADNVLMVDRPLPIMENNIAIILPFWLNSSRQAGRSTRVQNGLRNLAEQVAKSALAPFLGLANFPAHLLRTRRLDRVRLAQIAAFAFVMPTAQTAFAQAATAQNPVQRFDPGAGQGVRISPVFILHPEVTAQALHDTNVYSVQNGEISDTVFSLRPRLAIRSDFSRHRVEIYGGADIRRYASVQAENSEAADVGAKALLEWGGWINTGLELKLARGVEQRGTAGDQFFTNSPVIFTQKEAMLSVTRGQHKIEVALSGRIYRRNYQDNFAGIVPLDLSDRDLTGKDASLRLGMNLGSRVQFFTQIAGNRIDYQNLASRRRNSSGYALLAGARLQVTNLVDMEAGLGYIHQDFSNAGFKPVKAINYRLSANWTPTPNWLVTARVERAIDGSPLTEVPAIFRTSYSLEARRALGNRFLVGAALGAVRENYREIARVDQRYNVGATIQFRLNGNINLQTLIEYREQNGGPIGRNYSGVGAMFSVRAAV